MTMHKREGVYCIVFNTSIANLDIWTLAQVGTKVNILEIEHFSNEKR